MASWARQTRTRRKFGLQSQRMTDKQRIQNALAHHRAGRLKEAEKIYRGILDRDPNHLDALNLLGALEGQMGHREVAVELISRVLRIRPDLAIAHNNLGVNLKDLGRYDEAIAALRRCLELTPDYAEGYNNLGLTLDKNKQSVEALAAYRRALELNPNLAQANSNLANILMKHGDSEEAIALHRRAMQLNSEYPDAQSDLVYALQFQPDCDAHAVFQEHRRWDQLFGVPLGKFIKPPTNDPNPNRRLRIGYVSADFFYHSVSQFFLPLLRCHDHQQFEITCYSGVESPDQMTQALRASADRWVETAGVNDHDLAEKIRKDQIDILVDLSGHTGSKRLRAFAEKPAPVQVTYLGYPATTGLSAIDYRITDALADPPGKTEAFYSERLVRMPVSNWCYFAPPLSPPVKPAPDRPVCFGTFNNFSKASRTVRDLWIEILKAVPSSRLMLKSSGLNEQPIQDKIRQYFIDRGVAGDRIELYGHTSDWTTHLGLYDQMDISVDTFPYHGTTTTCEALWMGVPVVTLAGETHVSRVGVSLLTNVGLPELIAQTPGEYVSIAVALANDLHRLAELRRTLRPRMRKSPLMGGARLARDMEAAYRQMWRDWCESRRGAAKSADAASLDSMLKEAISHHQSGRMAEAETLYQKILIQKSDHADALHLLGVLFFQSNRHEPARRMIARAIEINPSSPDYYRNFGLLLLMMGENPQALRSFESALKLRGNFGEAHAGAGQALLQMGNLTGAIEHLRRAAELSPDSAEILRCYADGLQQAAQYDQAIAEYRRLLARWPGDSVATNNLAAAIARWKSAGLNQAENPK
jgi:protein O-GlcNAc transferase